ncbi:MAG: GNAT family N-acetyltransferase [Candidatus Obscuribacterales bacterium]|nr:GNAT family N-acetyltransferase [Candidatus Obscuribacterales bacterium]
MEYKLVAEAPNVENYCRLRVTAGLSAKTKEAANAGLINTYHGVSVLHGEEIVGMGRIIGDGGCFFQVVDIAVVPEHQGKGVGKQIMTALMDYLKVNAPESAHVTLLADGEAHKLYSKFGFELSAPESLGMQLVL